VLGTARDRTAHPQQKKPSAQEKQLPVLALTSAGSSGRRPDMDSVRSNCTRAEGSEGSGTPQDTSPVNSATSNTPKLYTSVAWDTWESPGSGHTPTTKRPGSDR
jgi:hypothetical protein